MKSWKECSICESPTARSVHFGARSCKACAAFFRRTVALGVKFECKGSTPCRIHYEKRMSCKKCRYDKCIACNMNPELVRSTRGTKDRSITPSENCLTTDEEQFAQLDTESPSRSEALAASRYEDLPRIPSGADLEREGRRWITEHYIEIEASLNSRRKIMYTDAKMMNVFNSVCKCPYEKRHLKPLNYKNYSGLSRADFIMLYDYATAFLDFKKLETSEKHTLYRYVCGVDSLMNSAYFTSCLAYDDKWVVLSSGEYICIDPMPMTGDEPWAQHLFSNKEDLQKYKSIIPWKAGLWSTIIVPFCELNVQFEEFCLLKALTCWHISRYKFGDNGRKVCHKQRDILIRCLHDVCSELVGDPSERVGNLILFISCVFQQMLEMINSLVMLTFFDIFDCDAVLKEFFAHESY